MTRAELFLDYFGYRIVKLISEIQLTQFSIRKRTQLFLLVIELLIF